MANLKIKKTDLKGPVSVGRGWLITRGWATLVGDDKRFIDLATINAGFAGLDAADVTDAQIEAVCRMQFTPEMGQGHARTNLLIEGEDGTLTRVYRNDKANGPVFICLSEIVLTLLGNPPNVERVPGQSHTFTCAAGLIACTTDSPPEWMDEAVKETKDA